MGIATDIVIQQRHRQNKGTGDEAAAAEIEAQEEDLEDVREALRGRLYQPAKRVKKVAEDDGTGLSALSSTGPRRGNRRSGQKNRVHPDQAGLISNGAGAVSTSWDSAVIKRSKSMMQQQLETLKMPSLRSNPPSFINGKWESINGNLAMMMKTPASMELELLDQKPQTPSPVRAKRGLPTDPKKDRRTLDLAISGDGSKIVACDTLGSTWVSDAVTGKMLYHMRGHKHARVTTCATSYGGGVVAAGGSDGRVVVWDCRDKTASYIMGAGEKPLHREERVNGVPYGVSTVEISPNGMFLASIGQDGNLFIHRLCNVLGGVDSLKPEDPIHPELLLQRPLGRAPADNAYSSDAALHHMAFSPDGRYCAACGAEGRFLLVELSNMHVHEFPVGNEDEGLLFVAFDKELRRDIGAISRHLALCSTKGSIFVYDIDDILQTQENCKMVTFKMPGGSVTACAFEPPVEGRQRRRRLAAGSEGGGLMIFDLEEKTQITAINVGAFGTETIHTVTYSPDANFLLAAGLGTKAVVIDPDTHSIIHMLTPGNPSDPITDVASRSADKAAMALAEAEKRKADARYIMAAVMAPDGNHVIIGLGAKSNGAVIQWDITPGAGSALLQVDDDELGESYTPYAAFLGNSLDAICSTGGGHLQIWDTSSSTLKKHIELEGINDGSTMSWEFNQESGLVVVRSDDDYVTVWNVASAISTTATTRTPADGDPMRFPTVVRHCFKERMDGCNALPSPCGRFLLKCNQHGRSILYQLDGQEVGEVLASDDMKQAYHTFKFSGDGSLLVGASMLGPRLDVWLADSSPPRHISTLEPMDTDSYRPYPDSCFVDFSIFHVPLGSQSNVGAITGTGNAAGGWWVSAVGSPIPKGSEPVAGGIYWWALVQPTPRTITSASFTHYPDHCPNGCSFSPNGRLLATYGTDGRVLVWEIKGKGRNGRVMGNRKLHKGGVDSVSWSKDSTMLLSNGSPGDAHGGLDCLYVSNATSGRVTAVLPARPTCRFAMAAFSDDGSVVVAPHKVGSVAVYNRSGAHDIAPTDASFFYRADTEQPGYFTEELINAMIRFPLMGNHVTDQGHNLVTSIVKMRDYPSLEAVLNVLPADVPMYSYKAGRWVGSQTQTWEPIDAMKIAIDNHDQGMLYDLLMAMADGKVTPESWETFLGHQQDSKDGIWGSLCSNFSSLVLVFLTKLNASELDNDMQFVDYKGKLEEDGLYVAGSSVYVPGVVKSFWERKTRPTPSVMKRGTSWCSDLIRKLTGGEEKAPPVPQTCVARRVDIPWIARAGEHGFLKAIVESDCPAAVYGTPVVRAVLQFKWKAYGMRKFATECFYHCLQLLTFTMFALLYSDMDATSCRRPAPQTIFDSIFTDAEKTSEYTKITVATVFQILSFIIALRNMGRELIQMKNVGPWKYFSSDPWNTMDMISYTAIFCILPINVFVPPTCTYDFSGYDMSLCGEDSLPDGSDVTAEMCSSWVNESWHTPGLDELIAVEVTFLWMECMNFATGFRGTGALVRIFTRTISDISWFMALQVVLMIGFGAGFAVLFNNQQQCDDGPYCIFNEAYDTIIFSFTSMFGLLLGDIGVLDFFNSPHPAWSVLMMILYEFLVFVVLFNMLIALMADTFVEVKESEEVEFLKGRADIICSQEETMSKKKLSDLKLFPRYLHTLVHKEDVEFQMALQSIQGGQDKTRLQLLKIQGDLDDQHKEILKELKKESKAISDEMKARIRSSSSGGHKNGRSGPSKAASSAVLPAIQESRA